MVECKQYLTVNDFADKYKLNRQHVCLLLRQQRIPGVILTPKMYLIPHDAKPPKHRDMTRYEYTRANYLSVAAAAAKNGISAARVKSLLELNLVEGAIRAGAYTLIPEDWVAPQDRRIKNSKYVGWRKKYGKKQNIVEDTLSGVSKKI